MSDYEVKVFDDCLEMSLGEDDTGADYETRLALAFGADRGCCEATLGVWDRMQQAEDELRRLLENVRDAAKTGNYMLILEYIKDGRLTATDLKTKIEGRNAMFHAAFLSQMKTLWVLLLLLGSKDDNDIVKSSPLDVRHMFKACKKLEKYGDRATGLPEFHDELNALVKDALGHEGSDDEWSEGDDVEDDDVEDDE